MTIAASIIQVLLAAAFLVAGVTKLMGQPMQVDNFKRWGYPEWFRWFTGACEVIAALGLLLGIRFGWLAVLAGLGIIAIMIGAVITHVRVHDSPREMLLPGVLLILAAIVVALRWTELSTHL